MSMTMRGIVALAVALLVGGCELLEKEAPPVPAVDEVQSYYADHTDITAVEISGNVVQIRVRQPARQLRRGGSLWAKVGPYITVFSPGTRDLLGEHPGVAAVRVHTHTPDGTEVARAMLLRSRMNGILWKRSLNLLGHALQTGTESPTRLEDLIEWGEKRTRYEYNPDFTSGFDDR